MRKAAMGAVVLGAAMAASPALAGLGFRLGTGTSMLDEAGGAEAETPLALGPGYKLDLVLLALEIDALYRTQKFEGGGKEVLLGLPVTARASLPLVPALLSLEVGGGLEPRFDIDSDGDDHESMVLYLPLVLGATFDLQLLAANAEIRYERQLTETVKGSDFRNHQLMFYVGAFF